MWGCWSASSSAWDLSALKSAASSLVWQISKSQKLSRSSGDERNATDREMTLKRDSVHSLPKLGIGMWMDGRGRGGGGRGGLRWAPVRITLITIGFSIPFLSVLNSAVTCTGHSFCIRNGKGEKLTTAKHPGCAWLLWLLPRFSLSGPYTEGMPCALRIIRYWMRVNGISQPFSCGNPSSQLQFWNLILSSHDRQLD